MKLYLVQHGAARSKEEDPERTLTGQGRLDAASTGRFLGQGGVIIHEIWHSGKSRARETAEIFAQALGTPRVAEKPGLAPLDPVEPLRAALMGREEDLMVVGHLPFLSNLANLLLRFPLESQLLSFRQGGVVCLERNGDGDWKLLFMVCPRLLK